MKSNNNCMRFLNPNDYVRSNFPTVSVWLILNPYPGFSSPAMIKVTPKTPSSAFSGSPIPFSPSFNNTCLNSVHVIQIVTVLKLSELGIIPVVIFTDPVTCLIAVDVQSSYSVSDYENSSSPGIIKASIFFIIIAVVWLIKVIRSVEFLVVEDAQKRQLDCTQSISILGITSFTLHLSCPVSLFTWKFCCCVGKTLLSRNEIRIIVD